MCGSPFCLSSFTLQSYLQFADNRNHIIVFNHSNIFCICHSGSGAVGISRHPRERRCAFGCQFVQREDLFNFAVVSTIPAAKKGVVVQWLKNLGKQDVWKMISDENDLAIAIRRLLVKPGGKMNIEWLDGTRMVYRIPKYTPKGGIEHNDQ